MTTVRITKEMKKLQADPVDGCEVSLVNDRITEWSVMVNGPANSPYRGGRFNVNITFPDGYPLKAPKAQMITKIYHPNVDTDGSLCLDILREKWSAKIDMGKVLLKILALMEMPNPDKPQDMTIAQQYKTNKAAFDRTASEWTAKHAR